MPHCGSQVILCDLPIRFDTYIGCTHDCQYCFTFRKYDISNVKKGESAKSLKNFIEGKRAKETKWCDWNIPLHWGGLSDPFQPAEREYRQSYECLKVLAETQYPVVVSTKGLLPAEPEYLELISQCNMIFQVSLVSPQFDKIEPGTPDFIERIEMIRTVAPHVKRVIIRAQPYVREVLGDIIKQAPLYRELGVYGVVAEGMKFFKKRPGLIRIGGDHCYPKDQLKSDFAQIRSACHKNGLKFYSGENRLRGMGDSLCCCGIDKDDPIFKNDKVTNIRPNNANLGHLVHDPGSFTFSKGQEAKGSAYSFKTLSQKSTTDQLLREKKSYREMMEVCAKDKNMMKTFLSRD